MSTISKVPFRGTPEQEQELLAVINELRDTPGNLVPVLQKAQDIYGKRRTSTAISLSRSRPSFPMN